MNAFGKRLVAKRLLRSWWKVPGMIKSPLELAASTRLCAEVYSVVVGSLIGVQRWLLLLDM